jgi:dipeptidyl-peptidase-4
LTIEQGSHTCSISPKGAYFIDTHNNATQPGRMTLRDRSGKVLRTLGDQKLPLMDEYQLGKTEVFAIPSGDGYDLPAKWTLPADLDPGKKYPVLFQVYGGPGAPSVFNTFPRLSDHFMAQKGIIVISVDHRGSGHFGKKGAALMHRQLGKYEMQDYTAAVKWLRKLPFVDSTRIGITGGSYGGYATLMALTAGADYFTHGQADFSVTDWRLYDNVYTERFMDTPEENPEGYKAASVMTHADRLKGKLLITHGTMDDNVHMQNTLQLIDKFEDLDKDFQLMLYPNGRHGIGPPKNKHMAREGWEFWREHFSLPSE